MTSRARKTLLIAALIIAAAAWVLPLYWLTTTAFKPETEIAAAAPTLWPSRWTLANFTHIWRPFLRPALNSFIVSGACTILIVLFSSMAGYALAKKRFPGRRAFMVIVIGTMLIPPAVLIVPLYCIIVSIGLGDTLTGLIIPFAVTAFGIFLMRQFAADIPDELLESAQLDGCSEWTIFWKIVVPLMKPPMAVLAIIEFVNNWNSFTVPFVLINSHEKRTLQLAGHPMGTGNGRHRHHNPPSRHPLPHIPAGHHPLNHAIRHKGLIGILRNRHDSRERNRAAGNIPMSVSTGSRRL